MQEADKIFHNGQIVTMDFGLNTVEALAVSGDRIVATGRNKNILALNSHMENIGPIMVALRKVTLDFKEAGQWYPKCPLILRAQLSHFR